MVFWFEALSEPVLTKRLTPYGALVYNEYNSIPKIITCKLRQYIYIYIYIYICINNPWSTDRNWLQSTTVFQILRVHSSNLGKIHHDAFRGMTSLRYLRIYNTALRHAPILSHIRSTLERLDLDGNQIYSIPSGYFHNCSRIFYINCRRNKLASLPDFFGVVHSVVSLLFGFNQIADIRNLYTYRFPLLTVIDLTSNLIESTYVQPRLMWPKVGSFQLRNNPLNTIELPLPYGDVKGFWLDLGVNPIVCNVTSKWKRFCKTCVDRLRGQITIRMACTHNLYIEGTCYNEGE